MARKQKQIAIVLPARFDYAALLLHGMLDALRDRTSQRLVEMPYDEGGVPRVPASFVPDGAVIWADASHRWVLDWRDRGVQIVSCNSEWTSEGIPCVACELDVTTDNLVAHLASSDPVHGAFVGHRIAQSPAKQRERDAFLASAARRGWDTSALEVPGNPPLEPHRQAAPAAEQELTRFLRRLPKRTAVYCDDDYVAALVCGVARHVGRAVPGDLAVLGKHDKTVARFNVPTISSQPSPGERIGAAAMQILLDMLAGKQTPAECVRIPAPAVVVRESTGGTTVRDDDLVRAHEMIQRLACQGLTAQQLTQRVVVSQKTFNRRFEAAYGRTLGAAIRHARAEKAKDWLATTDLSVGQIADMCGFEEATNFIAFFRREVGCTPGDYRNRVRRER